ncbi:hypothetical protein [Pseudanabaena sp. PCC 6802]|uniref:hypothetical protein n=1 Tax=Pseudanabaena sp. PCC 6802 TaxID=118173 RepID=UPI00034D3216|nr:hypothetical protein [Pseudanabaena sp. PCC 6802]
MQASSNEPTLLDVIQRLDKLNTEFDKLNTEFDKFSTEFDKLNTEVEHFSKELGQTQKWQDRTWDVVKWVGGISAGLSISAAIALVGLLLRFAGTGQ